MWLRLDEPDGRSFDTADIRRMLEILRLERSVE
jgi:hypothetical protein